MHNNSEMVKILSPISTFLHRIILMMLTAKITHTNNDFSKRLLINKVYRYKHDL